MVPRQRASLISGLGRGFGLVFSGAGDELLLSTLGARQPFPNFDVSDLAGQLERVLAAMTADPERRLTSLDLLAAPERVRLEELGNHAALTRPVKRTGLDSGDVCRAGDASDPEAIALGDRKVDR